MSLSLTRLLECARAQESAEIQASDIEQSQSNGVKQLRYGKYSRKSRNRSNNSITSAAKNNGISNNERSDRRKKCFKCGGIWPHGKTENCPAIGKNCNRCEKPNHFESVCRSPAVFTTLNMMPFRNLLTEVTSEKKNDKHNYNLFASTTDSESEENVEYIYGIKGQSVNKINTKTNIKICNRNIVMQVDS